MTMSDVLAYISHVFLPNRCMFCDIPIEYDRLLCEKCEQTASYTDLTKCLICRSKECHCQSYFRYLLSPFYYEMGADRAVRTLKFKDELQIAKKLAVFMAACVTEYSLETEVDLVIPAPLYIMDRKKRGFNQAGVLAREIAKLLSKPFCDTALLKTKQTKKQHDLFAEERYLNLLGAFETADRSLIADKKILLVDDVFTTGSTMNSCSKALLEGGAKQVIALVAAKTRFKGS